MWRVKVRTLGHTRVCKRVNIIGKRCSGLWRLGLQEKGVSFVTGANHSRGRRVNQRHVDPLQAVLGADDFRQSLRSRLT